RLIRVVLLDIEGTTTPIDFTIKTLFPYASARVEGFLLEHAHEPATEELIAALQAQHEADASPGLQPPTFRASDAEQALASAVAYLLWLINRDSKCTTLKTLQGKIWEQGYARGELRGEVYPDVPRAMRRWKEQGRNIAIYSSGSVLAQQLLFKTTSHGDLTRYISGFFDTRTGPKAEATSYTKIAASLGEAPGDILFLSDAKKEVDAARSARMKAVLCVRQAEAAVPSDTVFTFDEVLPH